MMKMKFTPLILCVFALVSSAVFAISGCASNQAGTAEQNTSFGYTIEEAIEVCTPRGQRQYLSRLICSYGETPIFYREGNVGMRTPLVIPEGMTPEEEKAFLANLPACGAPIKPGETDYHIVDAYRVRCEDKSVVIYMDMYHCNQPVPNIAPEGFTIK